MQLSIEQIEKINIVLNAVYAELIDARNEQAEYADVKNALLRATDQIEFLTNNEIVQANDFLDKSLSILPDYYKKPNGFQGEEIKEAQHYILFFVDAFINSSEKDIATLLQKASAAYQENKEQENELVEKVNHLNLEVNHSGNEIAAKLITPDEPVDYDKEAFDAPPKNKDANNNCDAENKQMVFSLSNQGDGNFLVAGNQDLMQKTELNFQPNLDDFVVLDPQNNKFVAVAKNAAFVNNDCNDDFDPVDNGANAHESYDVLLKYLLIGIAGDDRAEILKKVYSDGIEYNYRHHVGEDFITRQIQVDDTKVKLQIWDTVGQERFQAIKPVYFRGAHAIFFVVDLTNREKFKQCVKFGKSIDRFVPAETKITRVLLGQLKDGEPRVVDEKAFKKLQEDLGAVYSHVVNPKTGEGINEAIDKTNEIVMMQLVPQPKLKISNKLSPPKAVPSPAPQAEVANNGSMPGGAGFNIPAPAQVLPNSKKPCCKYVFIGAAGDERRNIIARAVDGGFKYEPLLVSDFRMTNISLSDGKEVTVQMQDTAGQERFGSLMPALLHNAAAVFFAIDLTSLNGFSASCAQARTNIRSNKIDNNIHRVLLGYTKPGMPSVINPLVFDNLKTEFGCASSYLVNLAQPASAQDMIVQFTRKLLGDSAPSPALANVR